MKKRFQKTNLAILLITLLSFAFRFYNLSNLPSAFSVDEAALGYNGWSLLTTSKDEWGETLPLLLRSFDDNKPAVYSYLTIPFIAIFGLNEFSTRAPAALFGSLLPLIIFLLLKRLKQNDFTSLLTAFIIATSPWHIEISRTAVEAGVALSIGVLALLFLSKSQFFTGLILILTSLFTYHTARLIVPTITLFGALFKIIKTNWKVNFLLIITVLLGIVLSLTHSSWRFDQISIFSDKESQLLREEAIREDGGEISVQIIETRSAHNKIFSWIYTFSKNYITNTSLTYLFLGGAQPPRVTIPETGQFLLITLPFYILGIALSIKKWKKIDKWLLTWLIFAPIPASLTTANLPHTYRTLFMLPPIAFFIAYGISMTIQFIKHKYYPLLTFLIIIFTAAFSLNFFRSWHQYRVHQQVHQPWYRQYGYKDLINYLNSRANVEKITITNRGREPYIFILFYNKISPKQYHQWPQKRLSHQDIELGKSEWQLFNYTFSEEPCPYNLADSNPNNLYVVMSSCELPKNYERINQINFLDSNPAFYIDQPSSH